MHTSNINDIMCTHCIVVPGVVGYDIFTFCHASRTRSEIGTRKDTRRNRRPAERSNPRNSVQFRPSAFHFFPFLPAAHRNWFNSYNNEHENERKQTNERHQHRNTNDATTIRPDPNRDRHSQKREKIVDLGVVMILPQVHLRKPCYDFTFL
jgi:hypothetical protein